MQVNEAIYRVIFTQQGKTYEIYAQFISEEGLMGFIEVEELIFADASVLIDPSEERLRLEFTDVKRCYIPMHAIARIDELMKYTPSTNEKLKKADNISHFPRIQNTNPSKTE